MVLIANELENNKDRMAHTCFDLNLEGYGPHPSQGKGILGLPPGATCVNKTKNVGLVRDELPRSKVDPGAKPNDNLYWKDDEGVRYYSPSGQKTAVMCTAPGADPAARR